MTAPAPVAPDQAPKWMTEKEVSAHTRIPVETLRTWRRDGAVRVLPFHKIGRLVRYERAEVDAAIEASRVAVAS